MLSLKSTLLVNGISSGITGLALVFFSGEAAALFGRTETVPFQETGIFLVVFAALVLYAFSRKYINKNLVKTITALDLIWVVASFGVLFFIAPHITMVGSIAIIAVALWVLAMAVLQSRGLRSTPGQP